jgi:hypothetical protein
MKQHNLAKAKENVKPDKLEELFKKDNVLIILFILKFKINYLS